MIGSGDFFIGMMKDFDFSMHLGCLCFVKGKPACGRKSSQNARNSRFAEPRTIDLLHLDSDALHDTLLRWETSGIPILVQVQHPFSAGGSGCLLALILIQRGHGFLYFVERRRQADVPGQIGLDPDHELKMEWIRLWSVTKGRVSTTS